MGSPVSQRETAVLGNQTTQFGWDFCCTSGPSHFHTLAASHHFSHNGLGYRGMTAAGCSGERRQGGRTLEVCSGLCSQGTAGAQPSHSQTPFQMMGKSLFGQPNQGDWLQLPALLNTFKCLWALEIWWPCGYSPRSWLADEVVRLNCCSRYFPRKAAKPATTAISMQAARMIQVKTGLESKCLVTLGITGREEKGRGAFVKALLEVLEVPCCSPAR